MFKLKKERRFSWPVRVEVPVDGKHEIAEFNAEFLIAASDELVETLRSQETGATTEFLKKHLVGWDKQLADEEGQPMPFSDVTRDALLSDAVARRAVVVAYLEGIAGRKRKN